jgi:hypothetical protein
MSLRTPCWWRQRDDLQWGHPGQDLATLAGLQAKGRRPSSPPGPRRCGQPPRSGHWRAVPRQPSIPSRELLRWPGAPARAPAHKMGQPAEAVARQYGHERGPDRGAKPGSHHLPSERAKTPMNWLTSGNFSASASKHSRMPSASRPAFCCSSLLPALTSNIHKNGMVSMIHRVDG